MTDTTTSTAELGANVDPINAIADLLSAEFEEENTPTSEKAEQELTDQTDDDQPDTDDESEQEQEADNSTNDDNAEDEQDDRTLSDLIGLDDSQVSVNEETGDLLINTKVDGKQSSLSFKEVLAGYQTQKHNTNKAKALASERKEFEEAAQEKIKVVHQAIDHGAALITQLEQELMQEYQATDWTTLRINDPAEYAARQQDQQARYNRVMATKQQVQQQREQFDEKQRQERQGQEQTQLKAQRELMLSEIPEWQDAGVMKSGVADMREFLTDSYGFSPEDIGFVVDARQVNIIRDAMAYRKGQKVAAKKVKAPVPKISRSKSTSKRAKLTRLDRLTKAAKTAKGADRKRAELDAVAELLS